MTFAWVPAVPAWDARITLVFIFLFLLLQFFLLSLWSVVHVLYSNHFHTAQLLSSKPSSQAQRRSQCFCSLLRELKHLSGWNPELERISFDYQGSFQLHFYWKIEIFTVLSVCSYFALLELLFWLIKEATILCPCWISTLHFKCNILLKNKLTTEMDKGSTLHSYFSLYEFIF